DKKGVLNLIDSIFKMYDYDLDVNETYACLKRFKFPAVDIFLVRLIAKEMMSMYCQDEIRLTDVYEKLALSEMYGDTEQLKVVSEELFDYVFEQSYVLNSAEYNAAMWSLPHKHNTYLEFLIAYYVIYRIENYKQYNEQRFFATMLTDVANRFMVSFLKDNYTLQETMLEFISSNYEVFNVQQKSNALYWLGRITYKNLANEAITMLTKEFTKYKALVKTNNKNSQENCNNHFLFRSICTGLLFQGQANMMDEYLCIVVTNDIANALNRGATIEYYGDNYQMVAHDAYYFDTDLSTGEQAIKILCGRIESALYGRTGKFIEANLVTLLTLLQARIQNVKSVLRFNIKPYVFKALEYLKEYQSRPQNVVSSKLLYYFKSVEEDLNLYIENGAFDIGPMIYNRYRALKQVKRHQWVEADIEDPESVSEHTFSAWMLAMFFLPEEHHSDGYNKKEILDMLLVHDMAEAALGDQKTSLAEDQKDLKEQSDVLKKLFLKGTYPYIANLTHYYNVWTGYYNGVNTNARTARDINLLQSIYMFCEYYCAYPEKFTADDVKKWIKEKSNLKTELGYQLFERLITNNQEFSKVFNTLE
ncbi:MAG: HD domain-containing protein, partial [Clostridia bacterium]|nr:HD domain-containing protein [Clostridia bacterium]